LQAIERLTQRRQVGKGEVVGTQKGVEEEAEAGGGVEKGEGEKVVVGMERGEGARVVMVRERGGL
jgi:hypothetical protein